MLDRLSLASEIDWSRAELDASSVPAKRRVQRAQHRLVTVSTGDHLDPGKVGDHILHRRVWIEFATVKPTALDMEKMQNTVPSPALRPDAASPAALNR